MTIRRMLRSWSGKTAAACVIGFVVLTTVRLVRAGMSDRSRTSDSAHYHLFCAAPEEPQGTTTTVQINTSVISQQQAIDAASALTGLGSLPGVRTSAVLEFVTKDDTPFLHALIEGSTVWTVTFENVEIGIIGLNGEYFRNPYITGFDVLVDTRSGKVVKITSRPLMDISPDRRLTAAEAEEILLGRYETYDGLPDISPTVNLLEAIQITEEGEGCVPAAKEIEALYVLYTNPLMHKAQPNPNTPQPRWIITARGIPALTFTSDQLCPGRK